MTRLCVVVALPCEARPWVDHYRLEAVPDAPLRTWRRDGVALVAGGIGAAAAAAAVGYLAGLTGAARTCVWINTGIAGHRHLARGELALVDRCVERASGRTWYPSLPVATSLPRAACITVDDVETVYAEDALYDMECAGFLDAAARFAGLDLVHSAKVVSDGPGQGTHDLDRDTVTALVAAAVPCLVGELVDPLLQCAAPFAAETATPDLSPWLRRWHFTASNRHRLGDALGDYQAVNGGGLPDPEQFAECRGAADVLARLRSLVDARAPRWD